MPISRRARSHPSVKQYATGDGRRGDVNAGTTGAVFMMALGLGLMGFTYGPLGTVVFEFFPTLVRYTGSSLAFSMAGILGASLAPYIATWLARTYGLQYVAYYLTTSAVHTFSCLLLIRETKIKISSFHPIDLHYGRFISVRGP
jgi:hypothetical protein